jgi:hypothetical protein
VTTQADIDARNEILDELKEALDSWHETEISRIDDEVEFVKSVLRGRTGSERLSRNTEEARILVIDDITSFLAGV